MPGTYNMVMYRGDSYTWHFRMWKDAAMTIPSDLTGVIVAAEIRDKSAGLLITPLSCSLILPQTVEVRMEPDMYDNTPAKGVWDLQLTFPDSTVETPIGGTTTITGDVTDSSPLLMLEEAVRKA